ncbi:signal peptidase I [Marinisporobacter balticus]|nr:signal peptidase I [Marinisporobacter balticus]
MLDKALKWIKRILRVLMVLILIERFIFGFTIIQGMSMAPTLQNNDKLFINKIVYLFSKPHYGDLIVFHPPIEERKDELFIKRIIAVEGERFCIKEGKLYINGKEIKEFYTYNEEYKERVYKVTSGKVPKNMVFVMGDNRNDSNDSRCFGFVPKRNIEGKANLRILPLDAVQVFSIK